jgi:hypothetical protein
MNYSTAVNAISSWLSILGLIVLVFWLYRSYRIDKFRQEMFALRDALFDAAADSGQISFDTPAYGMLRSTMNGYIRFGHRLSLLHLLVFWALSRPEYLRRGGESFEAQWASAVGSAPTEAREELSRFRAEMEGLLVKHVAMNSPILVLMVIPSIVMYMLGSLCGRFLVRLLKSQIDDFDSAALAYGLET